MEIFNPNYRINVKEKSFKIPLRIRKLLVGKQEVKVYPVGDPVNEWMYGLNLYEYWDENSETSIPPHPFLNAISFDGLCQGSSIHPYAMMGLLSGESELMHLATLFAFDEEGNIVGVSFVGEDLERPDELYREVTCTGVRGKGYGKMLDEAILAFAKANGKVIVRLAPANETARIIHTKMGFVNNASVKTKGIVTMKKNVKGGRRKTRRNKN